MKSFLTKHNKSVLLYLFITTLVGGSFMFENMIGGITFYAYRFFIIFALLFFLLTGKLKLYGNQISKLSFFILIVWLVYSFLSTFWVIDKIEAYKDIMYLLWGISTLIFLSSLKNNYHAFNKDLTRIWSQVFTIVILVSIWEIYSGTHISSNFTHTLDQLEGFHKLNFTPIFTFDNPNHFAVYLCLSTVLFINAIIQKQQVILNTFFIAICLFILHISYAKLGFITYFIFLVILLIYYIVKNKHLINYNSFAKSILNMCLIFSLFYFGIFKTNTLHTQKEISEAKKSAPKESKSTSIRKNLILNGFDFFIESKGKGVGAGNFKTYIQNKKGRFDTDSIVSPHNWAIEILSQYGILILLTMVFWGVYILKVVFKSIKSLGFTQEPIFVLLLFSCYLTMSNANSIFMPLPLNWVLFSLIALYTDDLLEKVNV